MRHEIYKIDQEGNTVLDNVIDIPDEIPVESSGRVILVNTPGGARIVVPSIHAGRPINLTKLTSSSGVLSTIDIQPGISFTIKSTVANDTCTVEWAVID